MNTALRDPREIIREEPLMHAPILAALADGPADRPRDRRADRLPGDEVRLLGDGDAPLRPPRRGPGRRDDEGYFRYASVRQEETP